MANALSAESLTEPGRQHRKQYVYCLVLLLVYIAFSVLLPLHRFNFDRLSPMVQTLLVLGPTAVFMFIQLLLSQSLVHLRLNAMALGVGGFVGLAIWVLILLFFHPLKQFGPHAFLMAILTKNAVLGVCLTCALTFFGGLLAFVVKEKNLLLPVALIAMPIDFVGAMTSEGFTHDMVKHAPKLVSSVSVSVPAITSQTSHGISIGPIAYIGPGDILFMSLFFTSVMRFHLAETKTFWWMYGLLTLSMIVVLIEPDITVGALVPMGLAVIIANLRLINLKRDEVYAVIYASILVLAVIAFFFWYSHRYLFHGR